MIRFRKWLAARLANLARRIYPKSPEYMAFVIDVISDQMIHGKSIVRVSPTDLYREG